MLIVHTADLHLGVGNYAPLNPSTGMSRRIDDFIVAFDHVVDYATQNNADIFLLCGDTFKDPNPNSTVLKMFASRLSRLSREKIQTVIILGNHDAPRGGRAAPPEPLVELNVPNVHYFSQPGFTDFICRSGEKARVFAIPYRHPVKVASNITAGQTGLRKELVRKSYLEQVTKEVETFSREGRSDADVCILAGHFSLEGVVAGSERNWTIDEEYALPPTLFDIRLFDYVAMGHVHKHQAIKARTPIVYPGSIERVDLAEADEEKGFLRVDIKHESTSWRFVKLPTRTMQNLQISCKEREDPVLAVKVEIANHSVEHAIVNLQMTFSEPITSAQKSEINGLLKGAFWSEVQYLRPAEKEEERKLVRTLDPTQALGEYLNSLNIPEAKRNEAMKIGQRIIEETTAKAEA